MSGAQASSTGAPNGNCAFSMARSVSAECSIAALNSPMAGIKRVFTSPGTGALAKTMASVSFVAGFP